jgi:hypothetical protein
LSPAAAANQKADSYWLLPAAAGETIAIRRRMFDAKVFAYSV